MKKINLNLTTKYFLLFWIPVLVFFIIFIYLITTLIRYPVKSEIRLPEEYRLFIDLIQRTDKIAVKQKKIEPILEENPFIDHTHTVKKPPTTIEPKRELTLRLTSIISNDRKTCIINQKSYREGDKIGAIKIVKIGDYYVELLLPSKKKIILEVGSTYTFRE